MQPRVRIDYVHPRLLHTAENVNPYPRERWDEIAMSYVVQVAEAKPAQGKSPAVGPEYRYADLEAIRSVKTEALEDRSSRSGNEVRRGDHGHAGHPSPGPGFRRVVPRPPDLPVTRQLTREHLSLGFAPSSGPRSPRTVPPPCLMARPLCMTCSRSRSSNMATTNVSVRAPGRTLHMRG